jgi:hypothetical protein
LGALPNTTPDTRNPKQDIIGLKAKADVIQWTLDSVKYSDTTIANADYFMRSIDSIFNWNINNYIIPIKIDADGHSSGKEIDFDDRDSGIKSVSVSTVSNLEWFDIVVTKEFESKNETTHYKYNTSDGKFFINDLPAVLETGLSDKLIQRLDQAARARTDRASIDKRPWEDDTRMWTVDDSRLNNKLSHIW